jgi:glycosyltransferase involved in cell wall biosynthesis
MVNASGAEQWRGGVEKGIALAAEGLIARGVEVELLQAGPVDGATPIPSTSISPDPAGRLNRRIRNRLTDVAALPTAALRDAIRTRRPDLVHTHNLPGISTGVWRVGQLQGLPIIHSLHDYYLLCPRASLMTRAGAPCHGHRVCHVRTRRLGRFADAVSVVTGVSKAVVDAHRTFFPGARFEVLRNPMAAFGEVEMRPPSREPMTVGYLGGLTHEKGIAELLGAIERLDGDSRFRFRIGGHGRLAPMVAAAAERLPALTFDGTIHREEKPAFIDGCDVGIIPSIWAEPGGPTHALAEWATASRPALVAARGGLAEVAGSVPSVITIEPTATGIVSGLEDLSRADRWAQVLAARPTWDAVAEVSGWIDRHLELYRELVPDG